MRSHQELAVYRRKDNVVRLLGATGHSPRYLPTGHIVYIQEAELRAIRFDIAEFDVVGESFRLLSSVAANAQGSGKFDVADNGTLVFVPGNVRLIDEGDRKLVWVDRKGGKTPLAAPAMGYTSLHINPEATRVAFEVRGRNPDVWVWDFEREALTRVTFDDGTDGVPLWSSSEHVLFESHRVPQSNVFEKAADGTGDAVRLSESPNHQVPLTISPDGNSIIFEERVGPLNNLDLVMFSRDTGVLQPLLATEVNETGAAISPDGRWIAYRSDETGQAEVFVRPFPNIDDGKWPITSTVGSEPTWSRDGDELFFLDSDYRLSVVAIRAGEGFNAGRPQRILEESFFNTRLRRSYDVSLDGTRFLMIDDEQDVDLPTEVHVVLNWFEELERLATAAE